MLSVVLLLIRQCLSLGTPQEKKAGNQEHNDGFLKELKITLKHRRKNKVKDLLDNSKSDLYLIWFGVKEP